MIVLLIILSVVFVAFIAFCALPIRLFWHREKDESSCWGLFFGIGTVGSSGTRIFGIKGKLKKNKVPKPEEEAKHKAKEKPKRKARSKKTNFVKILKNKGHRQTIMKIDRKTAKTLLKVAKGFKTQEVRLNIYAAFNDASVLGYACAIFYVMKPFFPEAICINFMPDFSVPGNDLQLFGKFAVQTRVYNILFAILYLLLIVPKWKTIRLIRAMRNN